MNGPNFPTAYHRVEFIPAVIGFAMKPMPSAVFYACLPNAAALRIKP